MAQKQVTESEAAKLNEAIKTLHNFCTSHSACKNCPFRKEALEPYGVACKFGSFYPELWDGLEIKEEVNT